MDQILTYARQKQKDIIALIRELVECESPSDSPEAIGRFVELFSARISDIAECKTIRGGNFGPHLRCEFRLPGKKKGGQILALGHSDTVYPMGTLAKMPLRQGQGRLWGPGVYDMKSGLVFFLFAMRAIRDLDLPVSRKVVLQLNSDEEVGSESSRALTEKEARKSTAVLVLEPGQGITGMLKTARKGVGDYVVSVKGKAAHAGVDFSSGASAILELARQIEKIAGFTQLERGITVNPGVISGGTRTNVIASDAQVEVDIRIARAKDAAFLEKKFKALKAMDKRCSVSVMGGLNRPPMERTPGVVALFKKAKALGRELGVDVEESSTGGGSDGNFTAALGVPTLDGLGGVGEGAHAPNESILIDRIADRTALLAKLVQAI
jgi:glutamate carboxypeptidase